jgi:hypothetical protein
MKKVTKDKFKNNNEKKDTQKRTRTSTTSEKNQR